MSRGRRQEQPQRSCIVCGSKKAKADLLRLVLSREGEVELDHRQRRRGRGAYVCRAPDCLARVSRARLERSLRRRLPETAWSPAVTMMEALQSHAAREGSTQAVGRASMSPNRDY